MSTTLTFANLDLTSPAAVAHACRILHDYANLPSNLLAGIANVTLTFEEGGYITDSHPAPVAPVQEASGPDLSFYKGQTRTLLDTMLARIKQNGSTTLSEAANDMNVTLDVARAYLRNAGRAAAARECPLPVQPKWNTTLGCNDYVAS